MTLPPIDNKPDSVITPISIFGPMEKYALLRRYSGRIEIHEHYQKRTMRNRTLILSANGPLLLTIPLKKGKTRQDITEVHIAYDENWMKGYLQSITSAYANAAYFDFYYPGVKEIILSKPGKLFELFDMSFAFIQKHIAIKDYSYTSSFVHEYANAIDIRKGKTSSYVHIPPYIQVFSDRFAFVNELSILDILFNLGPESNTHLAQAQINI